MCKLSFKKMPCRPVGFKGEGPRPLSFTCDWCCDTRLTLGLTTPMPRVTGMVVTSTQRGRPHTNGPFKAGTNGKVTRDSYFYAVRRVGGGVLERKRFQW